MKINLEQQSGAIISDCEAYRYSLWRIWDKQKPIVLYICLNPSVADANTSDRTLERCISFAKEYGYGGLLIGNLFAFRSTKISEMKKAKDPIGRKTDEYLLSMVGLASKVIVAWGNDGHFLDRNSDVLKFIKDPYCLKINKTGSPGHPLYIPLSSTKLLKFKRQ